MEFKEGPIPRVNSNKQDLLLEKHPEHAASELHAYTDSDWPHVSRHNDHLVDHVSD